jgi:Ca2+-binding EF-hand superfamily protein
MPIIKDKMEQSAPAEKPVTGEEQAAPGEEAATAEEQDAFKRVEVAAIDILYNEKTNKQFVQMLTEGAKTPANTMAQVAMQIFAIIDEKSGGKIPVSVVIQGAIQVLEVVRDMVEKTGLFEVNEAILGKAVDIVLKTIGERYELDPQEIQELMAEYKDQTEGMVAQHQQYAEVQ